MSPTPEQAAIEVMGLGKRYRIGRRLLTLREWLGRLGDAVRTRVRSAPRRGFFGLFGGSADDATIWALRDVSFRVEKGEVLGLIGRNGAGKSTLLKILSRITEPTAGEARVRGRVGSLLEVGTGFHPELTGRENVFLNGAILGMRNAEIREKFDEIVEFAGVEKFIDTPVKRYSTGMFVRLAFAVAAHLETEVLLVDEVLAVGDAEFQEKCLGKMGSVADAGRTVVFVSHSMPMIQTLCDRVLLLEGGRLVADGPTSEVVDAYLSGHRAEGEGGVKQVGRFPRSAGRTHAIREIWTENSAGEVTTSFLMGEEIRVCFRFELAERLANPGFGLGFETPDGRRLFSLNNYMAEGHVLTAPRAGVCRIRVPEPRVMEGEYWLSLSVVEDQNEWVDFLERVYRIRVLPGDVFGTGRIPARAQGLVYVPGSVEITVEDAEKMPADGVPR